MDAKSVVVLLVAVVNVAMSDQYGHNVIQRLAKMSPVTNVSALQTYLQETGESLNISNFYVDALCLTRTVGAAISEACTAQMDIVCSNERILNQMADAWSKFPYTGRLVASPSDFGSYDQCHGIYHEENGVRILGKHCTYGWAIPGVIDTAQEDSSTIYMLSYCVPDACSATDIVNMLTSVPNLAEILNQLVNDYFCSTKETYNTLTASEIAVVAFFGLFLLLIVVSTYHDVMTRLLNKRAHPALNAFSLVTNGQKLFKTAAPSNNQEQILAFHGLKAVSMMWILAGHSVGLFSLVPAVNASGLSNFEESLWAFYIMGAYFAVDTFFFLSGFLIAYQYFKSMAERSVKTQVMSVPSMILHRYIRITPAVLMLFLYGVYLAKFIGEGPMGELVNQNVAGACKEHWWSVFLYVQNYVNFTDLCYTHLWYLSTDFQLFLIAPFILIPVSMFYRKNFSLAFWSLLGLNVFFTILPLITKLVFREYDPTFLEYDFQSKLIDYFLGFTMGLYIRCNRHKRYPFNTIVNSVIWILTLGLMLGALLVYQRVSLGSDMNYVEKSLSYTFTKPAWCIGLSFIVFACAYGKGGFINELLSCGFMQIISKLSFCMYLMHVPVIILWVVTKRTRDYFSHYNLFLLWSGHFIMTVIVATIWSLSFESPLITIEGFIFGRGKRPPPPPKESKQNGESYS